MARVNYAKWRKRTAHRSGDGENPKYGFNPANLSTPMTPKPTYSRTFPKGPLTKAERPPEIPTYRSRAEIAAEQDARRNEARIRRVEEIQEYMNIVAACSPDLTQVEAIRKMMAEHIRPGKNGHKTRFIVGRDAIEVFAI